MLPQQPLPVKESSPSFFSRVLRRVDGCDMKIEFRGRSEQDRVLIDDMELRRTERLHHFASSEPVNGTVVLTPSGSSYSHSGVLVELIGFVTVFRADGEKTTSEFLRQEQRYEADTITQVAQLDFSFPADKRYESYRGLSARVAYVVRATAQRTMKNMTAKEEVWVSCVDEKRSQTLADASAHLSYFRETVFGEDSVAMDVGVDDVLHIEFRYDKKVFHLSERVLGKVTFKVAEMDLQYGEIAIMKKEFIGTGRADDPFESQVLQKYEIMDGTPIVGEVVPIRLYLDAIPQLTPTYDSVYGCFRVKYYLNLVLVNITGKRYYKQQEITLYRRTGQEKPRSLLESTPMGAVPSLP